MPIDEFKIKNETDYDNQSQLRLLSINKASKMLGIRYETVKHLVQIGKISSILINRKYKIPYLSLVDFVNGSASSNNQTNLVPIEDKQNRIDNLLKEYAD